MTNFVIKKDGTKVPFDSEKITSAVKAAALEAGLDENKASSVAGEVSDSVVMALENQDEVMANEIKEKVFSKLDSSYPEVAQSWRKYDQDHGK